MEVNAPLSPDEIRAALKLWVWKEKDDEILKKQLEFFVKELSLVNNQHGN